GRGDDDEGGAERADLGARGDRRRREPRAGDGALPKVVAQPGVSKLGQLAFPELTHRASSTPSSARSRLRARNRWTRTVEADMPRSRPISGAVMSSST